MLEKLKAITETLTFLAEAFKGLVRPVVTLGIASTFCYLAIKTKISSEVFMNIVAVVITFWFANREDKNNNGGTK